MEPTFSAPLASLELSQSLTTLFNKMAKYDQHCRGLQDILRVIDEGNSLCLEATPDAYQGVVGEATAAVQTMIAHTTCTAKSFKDWIEFLDRRAHGYVQIMYSLIAQRDNSSSIELIASSLRIAEAARSDNILMRAIAEDSRTVARESLHKTHTMHSMAVITMLFLPATFIATLFSTSFFSTSFFNFKPDDSQVVSQWIWVYILTTLSMTALTQGAWFLNTRNEVRTDKAGGDLKSDL